VKVSYHVRGIFYVIHVIHVFYDIHVIHEKHPIGTRTEIEKNTEKKQQDFNIFNGLTDKRKL
jgi:hypothetical protein